MKRETREKARQLRYSGMSVRDIAKTLSVSTASVSVWVRDIELTEEQKAVISGNGPPKMLVHRPTEENLKRSA
jgi:transposase